MTGLGYPFLPSSAVAWSKYLAGVQSLFSAEVPGSFCRTKQGLQLEPLARNGSLEAVGGAIHRAGALRAQEDAGRGIPERWPLWGEGHVGRQDSGEEGGGRGTPASLEQLKLAGLKLIATILHNNTFGRAWPRANQVSGAP